jgi:energy-coupling factor transport system ATP-binding protein
MIEIRGLSVRNLRVPSFTLAPGLTAVIGRNGAGKTTLLEVCCGLLLPDDGTVLVDGRPPREIDAGWVSASPDRSLLFSRVADELASSGRFAGLAPGEVSRRVREAASVTGAEGLLGRSVQTLSGGERSVVALAAALAGGPAVLALDEFDGHLDRETLAHLLPIVRTAGARFVLWSTHDPTLAAGADHIVALEGGRATVTGAAALALFDAWEREGAA